MSNKQNLTKEQLLKAIEWLEQNPDDRAGIFASVGITALGAGVAGIAGSAGAAILGSTTASIPIVTALTGIGIAVAAPAGLVAAAAASAAVAGGATVYGISRLIKDGGFHEGKRDQLSREYRDKLKDLQARERCSEVKQHEITDFYVFLKEPLRLDLISSEDAQQLIQAVENGHISLSEAYELVKQLFLEKQPTWSQEKQPAQREKIITTCPHCSQKLRAPVDLGALTLTCPKCQFSWWFWSPISKDNVGEKRLNTTSSAWCNNCRSKFGTGSCKACKAASRR